MVIHLFKKVNVWITPFQTVFHNFIKSKKECIHSFQWGPHCEGVAVAIKVSNPDKSGMENSF